VPRTIRKLTVPVLSEDPSVSDRGHDVVHEQSRESGDIYEQACQAGSELRFGMRPDIHSAFCNERTPRNKVRSRPQTPYVFRGLAVAWWESGAYCPKTHWPSWVAMHSSARSDAEARFAVNGVNCTQEAAERTFGPYTAPAGRRD